MIGGHNIKDSEVFEEFNSVDDGDESFDSRGLSHKLSKLLEK